MKSIVEVKKKICLIGDPAVGKTSLVRKYVTDMFDDKYIGTLGTKVTKKRIMIESSTNNFDLTIAIWDILGQQEFHRIQKMAYRGAKGVFLVCDLTRKETLSNLINWKEAITQVTGEIPMIILANKCDLEPKTFGDTELKQVAEHIYNAPFIITSAKTGINVDNSFLKMGQFITEEIDEFE
jgi:small GTP-binding protein